MEELLWILGLNKAAAPLWELLRGRRDAQRFSLMREFYSSLLPPGGLVFDIGANVGTMTRVFASLGAKVIAVEPNPDCIRHIVFFQAENGIRDVAVTGVQTCALPI